MFTNKLYPILKAFFNSMGYVLFKQDIYKAKCKAFKDKGYKEGYNERVMEEITKQV